MATPDMYEDDVLDHDLSAAASAVSIHEGAVAIERRLTPTKSTTTQPADAGSDWAQGDDTYRGSHGAAAAGLVVTRTGLVKIVVQNWRKEVTLFCGELVQRNSLVTIYKVRDDHRSLTDCTCTTVQCCVHIDVVDVPICTSPIVDVSFLVIQISQDFPHWTCASTSFCDLSEVSVYKCAGVHVVSRSIAHEN